MPPPLSSRRTPPPQPIAEPVFISAQALNARERDSVGRVGIRRAALTSPPGSLGEFVAEERRFETVRAGVRGDLGVAHEVRERGR